MKGARTFAVAIAAVMACGTGPASFAQVRPWSGTITIDKIANASYSNVDPVVDNQHTDQLRESIAITVAKNKVTATLTYSLVEKLTSVRDNEGATTTIVTDRATTGAGAMPNAGVSVEFHGGGGYSISFGAGGITGAWKETSTTTVKCKMQYAGCRDGSHTNTQSDAFNNLSGAGGIVTGKIGASPDALSGKQLLPFDFPGAGKNFATVTWSLTR